VDVWITLKGTAMTKAMSSMHFFLNLVQELLDTKLSLPQKLYFKFVFYSHMHVQWNLSLVLIYLPINSNFLVDNYIIQLHETRVLLVKIELFSYSRNSPLLWSLLTITVFSAAGHNVWLFLICHNKNFVNFWDTYHTV